MIGPTERYLDIGERTECRYATVPMESKALLREVALEEAELRGLEYVGECHAECMIIPHFEGGHKTDRFCGINYVYCAVLLDDMEDIIDGTVACVRFIEAKGGKGRLWTLGGFPDVIEDDGMVCISVIEGTPHLLLRCFYYHENLYRELK